MRRLQILVTVALATFLVHCGGTTGGGRTQTTDQQFSGYPNAPPIEDYISSLREGYQTYIEEGGFFFQGMTPPNEEAYMAIARNYRQTGLETLSSQDREALLLIAQTAFLSYAETIRYSVAVATNGTGAQGEQSAEAVLEEQYSFDEEHPLVARRLAGAGLSWPWPVWARRDEGSPPETRQFFGRPMQDSHGSWFVPETVWEKGDDHWSCLKVEIDAMTWAYSNYAYLENLRALGLGVLLKRDTVGGRSAYKFSGIGAEQQDLIYWLDAETLWLRQYEYELDGVRYRVKLEAVNEDIRIKPPDVDVPCVEETPSGEETPAP
jgi:hypothetical protein